ncbi:MAG: hypothetical protein JOY64_06575 [Alphaproteobacteria bacterium]|nr:hypothetical protein [Alphaproteobacteria bacterium]MBV8407275.1 hypothetical protein [Alphaproteobacteria bacterium]
MAKGGHIDPFGKVALPALLSGHKPTWDAFVRAAVPLVMAVVHRALPCHRRSEEAVAEAVQKVFVDLSANDFRLLKNFDPARASLSTWLAVISWSRARATIGQPAPWVEGHSTLKTQSRD